MTSRNRKATDWAHSLHTVMDETVALHLLAIYCLGQHLTRCGYRYTSVYDGVPSINHQRYIITTVV